MFQIIGAMAELERSLIQERVKRPDLETLAKGKKFGRPRVKIDAVRVAELRRDGLSWSPIMSNPQCERERTEIGCTVETFPIGESSRLIRS